MNHIHLMILAFGLVALVGCTGVTQVDPNQVDDGDTGTDDSNSGDTEVEPTVLKKLKANPDLEESIQTLRDHTH